VCPRFHGAHRRSSSEREPFLRIEGFRKLTVRSGHQRLRSLGRKGRVRLPLGPSGCGKTTTLHIIAGFIEPERGTITLDGRRLDRTPSHERGATMVFQNYALFPHMSVFRNVAFGLRMQGAGKEIERGSARRLNSFVSVNIATLSARVVRRQQQRVALARAIAPDPKLLLLDEPLSNLDAKLRKELRAEFSRSSREGHHDALVTHDLEEASRCRIASQS